MISLTDVTKRFPDGTQAVESLNLHIPGESVTVFVGPSGCGKTTSLRMINRMVEPTTGTISIDGRDTSTQSARELRSHIGYVMQDAGLMPHRTVLDNVATVPRLHGATRRAARLVALNLIERVGLDVGLALRYPDQLSGGQRQRVGVARALAGDPPVLLMDEPFSAVDPVARADLQQELIHLQQEVSKTIVFVTHDIDEAVTIGDRVVVFGRGGTIQQNDTPEMVLRHPANDFVAQLIGRDRGFRALAFERSRIALSPIPVFNGRGPHSAIHDWAILLDNEGRPHAWIAPGHLPIDADSHVRDHVPVTVATSGSSVRQALDAALASPAGVAPVVDDVGALLGGVSAEALIAEHRRTQQQAVNPT